MKNELNDLKMVQAMKTLSAAWHKAFTNKYVNRKLEIEQLSTENVTLREPS